MRINPTSAKHVNVNWDGNEQELVDQLFINKNVKKLRKQLNDLKVQKTSLYANIKEMQARLKKNPNDETAQNELSTLQNQKDTIDRNVEIAQKNYDRISRARFGDHILGRANET